MRVQIVAVLIGSIAMVGTQSALAQDNATSQARPKRCVTLTRIDHTKVVDDQTILFYMLGDTIYMNHMARDCPGLMRENRFMYEVRGNRLCGIDTITVLMAGGFGLTRGFTCPLGKFQPITETEAKALQAEPEGKNSGFSTQEVNPENDQAANGQGDDTDE